MSLQPWMEWCLGGFKAVACRPVVQRRCDAGSLWLVPRLARRTGGGEALAHLQVEMLQPLVQSKSNTMPACPAYMGRHLAIHGDSGAVRVC